MALATASAYVPSSSSLNQNIRAAQNKTQDSAVLTIFQRRLYLQRILEIRREQRPINEAEYLLQGDVG